MKTVEEAAARLEYRRHQFEDALSARSMYSSAGNPNLLAEAAIEHTRQMYIIAREEFADAAALAAVETARAAFDVLQQPRAEAVPDDTAEISNYAAGFKAGARDAAHTVARLLDARGEHAAADLVLEYARTRNLSD